MLNNIVELLITFFINLFIKVFPIIVIIGFISIVFPPSKTLFKTIKEGIEATVKLLIDVFYHIVSVIFKFLFKIVEGILKGILSFLKSNIPFRIGATLVQFGQRIFGFFTTLLRKLK